MSTPGEIKIEVQERGAKGQRSDRRLWMQLQVLGGCGDPKPLVRALEASRLEAVLYQDVNDPRGVGLLAIHEDPTFFVNGLRGLLTAEPFAGLVLKPELTMLGRTYSSGFEPDLEDWLLHRPSRSRHPPRLPRGGRPRQRLRHWTRGPGPPPPLPPDPGHAEDGPDLPVPPDAWPLLRRPRPLAGSGLKPR